MEGKPIEQVRALWAAYQRGGIDAVRELAGDVPVDWIPLGEEQVSIALHSLEEHGPCVIAHGSMRTFSEGGFSDVQPSWVYCFRDGVLVHARAYPTRQAALEAISRWRAE